MTQKEAAAYVRMSVKTLQRRRASGHLAYVEDCGKILYRRSDLDAYLHARHQPATAKTPPPRQPKYIRSADHRERNRTALLEII